MMILKTTLSNYLTAAMLLVGSILGRQQVMATEVSAVNAPTRYVQAGKNKIAYRTIGKGSPILLCNRLRGILDTWDPAFLDELAKGNQVFIFDYPGIGLSSGQLDSTILGVANDVKYFASALHIQKFNLLGWSYGGAVAQTFAAHYPEMINHLILIGANPPGKNDAPVEQAFLTAAFKPINDLSDEEILFFEPASAKSRAAAKASNERIAARKTDLSMMVTPEKFAGYFKGVADYQKDNYQSRAKLASTTLPILILMGDHDPSCPVENWFPLVKKWRSAQLVVIPNSGHGVQHEFPKVSTALIELFVRSN